MKFSTEEEVAVADPAPRPGRIEGTPQQHAFWDRLTDGEGHDLLEARAGTGKSTSCREGMFRVRERDRRARIRYAVFNKKIADEFRERCPDGVEVGTMHSFGLKALQRSTPGLVIEKNKSYVVLDALPRTGNLARWMRKTIVSVVSIAKNHALDPAQPGVADKLEELILHYDVETWNRTTEVVDWACDVLEKSLGMVSMIDFDDMLYLPVMRSVTFPEIDHLFIDECQDLNETQHRLVPLMNPTGRTAIVGDPFQAIYMWRGADAESIPKLRERLDATRLPLTVTFRCPKSHVDLARQYVPDFEAAPDAPDGIIAHGRQDAIEAARPGALVLCRTNAPNIASCLKMIAQRKRANVRGRALGDQLGAVVRRIEAATVTDLSRGIALWRAREVEKLERRDGTEDLVEAVNDKALALTAIVDSCSSPAEVPRVIDQVFSDDLDKNRVTFSSVHRAKGMEARDVFYLQPEKETERDRKRPPQDWEVQQRRNIEYVALTRSLHSLTLVTP